VNKLKKAVRRRQFRGSRILPEVKKPSGLKHGLGWKMLFLNIWIQLKLKWSAHPFLKRVEMRVN